MYRTKWIWLAVAVAITSASVPARAGHVAIGTNLGLNSFWPEGGGDSFLAVTAPGTAGLLLPGFMPGLRLSVAEQTNRIETFLEQGLYILSSNGETLTEYELTANGQYNFTGDSPTTAFVTLGGGFLHFGAEDESITVPVVGGGIGGRHRFKHGYGAARAEVRFDWLGEDESGFDGGTAVGLKIGFDVYLN